MYSSIPPNDQSTNMIAATASEQIAATIQVSINVMRELMPIAKSTLQSGHYGVATGVRVVG